MANILIVEDEKNMQEIIAEYMQRGGHTCFTADDGVDALMILKNAFGCIYHITAKSMLV